MPSTISPSIVIQTSELMSHLNRADLLPVFVGSREAFENAHIPGSVHLSPQQLVCGMPPAAGKIADESDLSISLSQIGLTPESIVIAYDDEGGGWAGRLIWTLDVIAHENYHFLDGGTIAWLGEGRPVENGYVEPTPGEYPVTIDRSQIANVEEIISRLGEHDFSIWDARSPYEHSGEKVVAARGGRIPGAVNLDWLELMDRNNYLRLKPLADIQNMLDSIGINQNKEIVTHCQSHHRSGLTYLTGKILGLNIRAYDGSWSEWGNLDNTPIESDV